MRERLAVCLVREFEELADVERLEPGDAPTADWRFGPTANTWPGSLKGFRQSRTEWRAARYISPALHADAQVLEPRDAWPRGRRLRAIPNSASGYSLRVVRLCSGCDEPWSG